jgi:hypothetical protein
MTSWATALIVLVAYASSAASSLDQTAVCPARSETCVHDLNLAICQGLLRNVCKRISILESCPVQFSCADPAPPPTRPTSTVVVSNPVHPPTDPVTAPKRTDRSLTAPKAKSKVDVMCGPRGDYEDNFYSDEAYYRCRNLVRRGCRAIESRVDHKVCVVSTPLFCLCSLGQNVQAWYHFFVGFGMGSKSCCCERGFIRI